MLQESKAMHVWNKNQVTRTKLEIIEMATPWAKASHQVKRTMQY